MSTNEQSELTQFQENGYEKSKCETKFTLAEERKKKEEERQKQKLKEAREKSQNPLQTLDKPVKK